MQRGKTALLILALALLPSAAAGQVLINEVAWAGASNDPNNEWIELFNSGTGSVDLSGYRIVSDDGAPSITLSGSIAVGAYFLLERTDDESAPGVSADLFYTGALGNEGERLRLLDANGSAIDTVSGADGWSIGGDATSKATLQRMNGGWGTADGTPKRANAALTTRTQSASSQSSRTSARNRPVITGKADTEPTKARRRTFVGIDIGEDTKGTVSSPLQFQAIVFDDDGSELLNGTVTWTLGDGSTRTGRTISHVFTHPGTYVVSAKVHYEAFDRMHEDQARIRVDIDAPTLAIKEAGPKLIAISNEGSEEADLSGFSLVVNGRAFRFPDGSYVLPLSTMRIASDVSRLAPESADTVRMYFPGGSPVVFADTIPEEEEVSEEESENETDIPVVESIQGTVDEPEPPVPADQEPKVALAAAALSTPIPKGSKSGSWSLLLLLGVIGAGMAGMVAVRREQDETKALAKQFRIIDDSEENP